MKFISYQVRRPSGKPKGELTFSYKFGEKVTVPKPAKKSEPVMAYPVGATKSTGYPTVQQKPTKKKSSGMGFHRSFHLLSPHIHRSFHDLSLRFGPIFTLRLGSVPCIVVMSPELAKEFLKTLMLSFINRPGFRPEKILLLLLPPLLLPSLPPPRLTRLQLKVQNLPLPSLLRRRLLHLRRLLHRNPHLPPLQNPQSRPRLRPRQRRPLRRRRR
ncbi:hypothetical protein ACLB2K_031026 [Fragaria x ananassa]